MKVSLHNNKVFRIRVDNIELERFASILGCEPANFPFTYLGLPIGSNMKLSKHWTPIVEKFKSKLSNWKGDNISFGGRLMLVKFVLWSLPLYYVSLFKAIEKIIDFFESIRRRFLRGGKYNKRKFIRFLGIPW